MIQVVMQVHSLQTTGKCLRLPSTNHNHHTHNNHNNTTTTTTITTTRRRRRIRRRQRVWIENQRLYSSTISSQACTSCKSSTELPSALDEGTYGTEGDCDCFTISESLAFVTNGSNVTIYGILP